MRRRVQMDPFVVKEDAGRMANISKHGDWKKLI